MEKLKVKSFASKEEMIKWANGKDGTDWICAITFAECQWQIFYIK